MQNKLTKIFKEDQIDRKKKDFFTKIKYYSARDLARKEKVIKMLKNKEITSGEDFYMVAIIFHHGKNLTDYKKAISLSKKSFELGHKKAGWLYAASTDRYLMKKGEKQKFGTQFFRKNNESDFTIYKTDSKTSDQDRKKYGVPSLKQIQKDLENLNKKWN